MTDPTHDDLKESFARLREEDRRLAPRWKLPVLAATAPPPTWPGLRLSPLSLSAALSILLGLGWLGSSLRHDGNDINAALPELFTPQGSPLFSSLASTSADMPSDSFLPSHLTLQLP